MKLAQKKMLKLYGTRWHYMFLATEAPDFHPCLRASPFLKYMTLTAPTATMLPSYYKPDHLQ